MELYLVRHTPPRVPVSICYGRAEVGVEPREVRAAAAHLRPLLPSQAPLHASPLERCRLLAEALAAAPHYDERLQEMHFGEWELKPWDEIDRAALDAWRADLLGYAPPGGESVGALFVRVGGFLEDLRAADPAAAVIVAHSGVLRAIAGQVLGLAPQEWTGLRFDFGAVSLIVAAAGDARLAWHNR